MKPIILHGHGRPIKDIKFNKDGDLLFTASSDRLVSMWSAETGERIGTFSHSAAVNTITITKDSKIMITGDSTGGCYFWEVYSGKLLKKIDNDPTLGVRCVDLSYGDSNIIYSYAGRVKDSKSAIDIFSLSDVLKASSDDKKRLINLEPLKSIEAKSSRFTSCKWLNINRHILAANEDGMLRLYDANTLEIVQEKKVHTEMIMDLDISKKEEIIATVSKDGKSCIIDPDTFDILSTLHPQDPTRNLNSCSISPLFSLGDEDEEKYHVIIGGGQESKDVTTTHAKKGGFETLIYNVVYGDELGAIQGHFGPINTLTYSPDGKFFASGAEDSTVRLHKLDEEYFNL
jgi:translation initiation factor 3 subunit I